MSPMRIVVADDSDVFRKALCHFIQHNLNITVLAIAHDGLEALRLVEEMKPDLLILDMNMPKMSGWEVLCQLQESSTPVYILVLTAHVSRELERRALETGADAWVPKGNIEMLCDTLQRMTADNQV